MEKLLWHRLTGQPRVADTLRLSLEILSNFRIGKEYL